MARNASSSIASSRKTGQDESLTATSARTRVNDAPYRLVTGTLIASSRADLTDGSIAAPIDRNELGALTVANVWTGTFSNGVGTAVNCSNWTNGFNPGLTGETTETGNRWTSAIDLNCTGRWRLYCFEVGVTP